MLPTLNRIHDLVTTWARKRFVLPVLMVAAVALLLVSEATYRGTTATLRGGIALTDSRIQSQRLLQLVTDAENAEFGFLVTGDKAYIAQYELAKAGLPELQREVSRFLSEQGPEGAATARRVNAFASRKIEQVDRTFALALANNLAAANELARNEQGRAETQALREEMKQQLDRATAMQQTARVSIYDALLVNRLAVGALTFATLLSLFLFIRQLHRQDRRDQSERARLEAEVQRRTVRLRELAQHFQTVREDERSRLARELHDELGALLTVTKLEIARVKSKAAKPDDVLAGLDRVVATVNEGIALKRRIIEDLTPSSLTHLGLTIALQNLCADMSGTLGIPVRCSVVELQLTPEASLAVYRFIQEALTNIGKYAGATQVEVELQNTGDRASVTVRDDGVGFDPSVLRPGGHGLSGMQFRAESLGGSFSVESLSGKGSTLRMEFVQALNGPSLA